MRNMQQLFPDIAKGRRKIKQFETKDPRSFKELPLFWNRLVTEQTPEMLKSLEPDIISLLSSWHAYRNQPAPHSNDFLTKLVEDPSKRDNLFSLVNVANTSASLSDILNRRKEMESVYNFLNESMLEHGVPARIVTVSKALLMVAGFSIGFDGIALKILKKANPSLLACPGVWPFDLYHEHLTFVADQQSSWETKNGKMGELIPGTPIGQIMDRIIWT